MARQHQFQIKHGSETNTVDATLPNDCPICHTKIQPHPITVHVYEDKYESQIVLKCNNDECESFFIAYYSHKDGLAPVIINPNTYDLSLQKRQFSDNITEISPDFISIYNEAQQTKSDYGGRV